MDKVSILNLGAGKMRPLGFSKYLEPIFLINLDKNYYSTMTIGEVENFHRKFKGMVVVEQFEEYGVGEDVFQFLERYSVKFDYICMYRLLEHISRSRMFYFIHLLQTMLDVGGMVDVVVPNYKILAKRILEENVYDVNFDKEDIITTTELLNEPNDSHASIWTSERAKYMFEYEGRFKVDVIDERFMFDGRDIYLRFKAMKMK